MYAFFKYGIQIHYICWSLLIGFWSPHVAATCNFLVLYLDQWKSAYFFQAVIQEKTQSIRHTILTLSTYITMRRLSRSDIQYRPYLHMWPWEESINQIYNTDPIYICYHEKNKSIRYTIPTLSTYVTERRLSRSDMQYWPYLHMLPWENSVNQIYNTGPIYICYNEKTQFIRYTIPTLSTYVTKRRLSR